MDGELADGLATEIAYNRRKEIEDEFFREVSATTYNKWFVNPFDEDGLPFLDAGMHGGYFRTDGEAVHYYMLKRKYYSMYKSGNRYLPRKKSMEKSVSFAKRLMHMGFDFNIKKLKTSYGVRMQLGYASRSPSLYKNTKYEVKYDKGAIDTGSESKEGRLSSIDRLILKSIKNWSYNNDLVCAIEMYGGE